MDLKILALGCLLAFCSIPVRAAVTVQQRQQLEHLQKELAEAGKLFAGGKFAESAKRVREVQTELLKLVRESGSATLPAGTNDSELKPARSDASSNAGSGRLDPALIRLANPLFSSLQRAHALLELEGVELDVLPTWESLTEVGSQKPSAAGGALSFANDIAPILVAKCGACHIDNQRGQFSMVSFADLMRGDRGGIVIRAGASQGSRMIEVIETGDMPRGNGKVLPEELTKLKKWIDDGAKFDGPSPDAAVKSYANRPAATSAQTPAMEVTAPTGKEVVQFTRDIAPILLDNCNGCHMTSRQISAQLRMDTFSEFIRGGNRGEPIVKGRPLESLLIKKLKGESGLRMPAGDRPPLSDDKIKLISTWILEGATFDGPDPSMPLSAIVAQKWADSASHPELLVKREERGLAAWRKVLPNIDPTVLKNSELVVLGNVAESRLSEVFKQVESALAEAKRFAKVSPKEPLIRGGMVLFVFKGHYEYTEHGKMNEQRQLPSQWRGHWTASPLDVYGALVDAPAAEPKQQSALLLQLISGAYLGSLPQVPLWFAEGVARNLAATTGGRNDPRVLAWQQTALAAVQKVDRPEVLINGQLDEESAGLVGMSITKVLVDRTNRKRFDVTIKLLREGRSFPDALKATFVSPDQLVKSWLGKK